MRKMKKIWLKLLAILEENKYIIGMAKRLTVLSNYTGNYQGA